MNILIIGGTGFLATYLKNSLCIHHHLDFTYANQFVYNGIKYEAGVTLLNDIIKKNYDIVINNINPQNLSYSETLKSIEDIVGYCNHSNTRLIQVSSVSALYENRHTNSYNLKKAITEDVIITEMKSKNFSIIRFTQLFDSKGLSRKSQAGLYYLLDCIKHEKYISVFKNKQECCRNYTPVEIAINFIEICIDNNLQGIFNAHIDDFTFSFNDLVEKLASLNKNYDTLKLVIEGDKMGLPYFIAKQSDELVLKLKSNLDIENYFKEAYSLVE